MDLYKKERSLSPKLENPFEEIIKPETKICNVQVSEYSQVNKVLGYALRKVRHKETEITVLIGQGKGGKKATKVAEILMSKINDLHRCDAMGHKIHEDIWTAKEDGSLLDDISVVRHIPVTFILLAKNQLPNEIQAHPQRLQIHAAKTGNRKPGPGGDGPDNNNNTGRKNQHAPNSGKPKYRNLNPNSRHRGGYSNQKVDRRNGVNGKQTVD